MRRIDWKISCPKASVTISEIVEFHMEGYLYGIKSNFVFNKEQKNTHAHYNIIRHI